MRFAMKLALVISATFLSGGAVLAYLQGSWSTKTLEAQIVGQLEDRAFHAMERLDAYLHEKTVDARSLAADPVLASGAATPPQIVDALTSYLRWHTEYRSASFFTMDRVRVADTAGLGIGERHALKSYWVDVAEGRDLVAGIHLSESLQIPVFHIAAVVRGAGGERRGVVVFRLALEFLDELVRGVVSGPRGVEAGIQADLVDRDGMLLASSYNREGVLKGTSTDWVPLRERFRADQTSGSLRYTNPREKTGEEILVFVRERGHLDYPGNGWTMLLDVPARTIFAPAHQARARIVLVVLVTGALLLLVTLLAVRAFARPISDLSQAAAAVGRGNLEARVEVRSRDELGRLAEDFNRMTGEMRESRRALTAYSHELEGLVGERTAELLKANERLHVELSERMRAQEALEIRTRLQQMNANIGEALTSGEALAAVLQLCAGHIARDLEAAFVRIWTPGSAPGILELRASAGEHTRLDGRHSRKVVGELKIGIIAKEQRPLLANAVIGDPDFTDQAWAQQAGMVAFAGYPLVVDGRTVGVMGLFFRQLLEPLVLTALENVAIRVGSYIGRKQAEEALLASEKRYRDLFDASTDGIYRTDVPGVFTSINPAGARIFGYDRPEELLGRSALDFWRDPDDRTRFREELSRVKSVSAYRVSARRKDGSFLELESSSRILESADGAFIGIEGVLRDVTERVRAEGERELLLAQLQEAAASIRTLSGLLPICAGCKKIRDDQGSWNQIETYISSHSEAEFSHGLCPDCQKVYFPGVTGKS